MRYMFISFMGTVKYPSSSRFHPPANDMLQALESAPRNSSLSQSWCVATVVVFSKFRTNFSELMLVLRLDTFLLGRGTLAWYPAGARPPHHSKVV
ncbi:hypothetical protein BKA82DRAFT_34340 [Pisolithus tinctorius]|uniref:Uncharacterized protein n=1 Tax=Pisolithus tinctorius Marx 270 TaxID=870435 RepID=A0A0C3NHP0_PISTI|nr:hypothetical protein BKA82DRAFT_34340 [Pisolithus tinctorius]KIN95220.1 hypothetical protein M404DRAFT_34340 [Pisolithus tinctorius Marx 270]